MVNESVRKCLKRRRISTTHWRQKAAPEDWAALIGVLATRGPEAELPRGTIMDVNLDRSLVLDAAFVPESGGGAARLAAIPVSSGAENRSERKRTALRPPLVPWIVR